MGTKPLPSKLKRVQALISKRADGSFMLRTFGSDHSILIDGGVGRSSRIVERHPRGFVERTASTATATAAHVTTEVRREGMKITRRVTTKYADRTVMQLLHLRLPHFRNLRGMVMDFATLLASTSGAGADVLPKSIRSHVLIDQNGVGKSNLIEAFEIV